MTQLMKTILPALFLAASTFSACNVSARDNQSADYWRETFLTDLQFIKDTIDTAHPGMLNHDADFKKWFSEGYINALTMTSEIQSRSDVLALLRYFVVGFNDGHLTISDPNTNHNTSWAGWTVEKSNGHFRVSYASKRWASTLPVIGSKIIQCDGQPISKILREDLAPFIDQRLHLAGPLNNTLKTLTIINSSTPRIGKKILHSCLFENNGSLERIMLTWAPLNLDDYYNIYTARTPVQGIRYLSEGIYWLSVPNFNPTVGEYKLISALIESVRNLSDAKYVVIDSRGNAGGYGTIGAELLEALAGEAVHINNLRPYALWRVSELAITTNKARLASAGGSYGADSSVYRWLEGVTDVLVAAQRMGQAWAEQLPNEGFIISDPKPTVDLRRRKLILITDHNCASACLDFANAVKHVPGAIHLGQSTSADSIYNDVALVKTPGGFDFQLPLKVWKNRPLANNEPLVPTLLFEGDINDTVMLERWVLETLEKLEAEPQS